MDFCVDLVSLVTWNVAVCKEHTSVTDDSIMGQTPGSGARPKVRTQSYTYESRTENKYNTAYNDGQGDRRAQYYQISTTKRAGERGRESNRESAAY